ncbi:MAG: cytochrome c biogenesis protein CcsA [Bacteroidota bacterium]
MKKVASQLFSMPVTGLLLLVFAGSIAYATFLENDFGTTSAKVLVYDSWWFKTLLLIFALNLMGSIFVNKIISGKKWSMLLFHVSFLFILAGGALTRYGGMEGNMHIREGQSSNAYISEDTYVSITISDGRDTLNRTKAVKFSERTKNRFRERFSISNQIVTVENIQFLPSVNRSVVEDENGIPLLSMVAIGKQKQRLEFFLGDGEDKNFNNIVFSFNKASEATTVLIEERDGELVLTALNNELWAGYMGSELTRLPSLEEFPLNNKTVYQIGHLSFILKEYIPSGRTLLDYGTSDGSEGQGDAFRARITAGGQSEIMDVFGSQGLPGQVSTSSFKNLQVSLSYGSLLKELPFALRLEDFQMERYPGSNSPSSFASVVTLIDSQDKKEIPYRIYMNNILKHKGYRFFQTSYDEDELGTVLSVNYDSWGTTVTYLGYLMMTLGMVFSLFNRNSRFKGLIRASAKLMRQRTLLLVMLMLGTYSMTGARDLAGSGNIDKAHTRAFGELLVQTNEGRIEPLNSLASKILRKVNQKNNFEGLSPAEVYLGMLIDPETWSSRQIIKISSRDLKEMLGISSDYVSFNEMTNGGYKLTPMVEAAYGKSPAARSKTDREVLKLDERVNICYLVLRGEFLKIFPIPGDVNHKWISLNGDDNFLPAENREFAIRTQSNYMEAVKQAKTSGNWDRADELLNELKDYQIRHGSSVLPGSAKVMLEIFYINLNLFGKLSKLYLLAGLSLLFLVFLNIFRPEPKTKKLIFTGTMLVILLFTFHTMGLAMRWYISGHAPWSNGYESMIFISWATSLSGLVFAKRSHMALAATTVLSGLTLVIAGLSWMSPEITNLVPVLKSYWLIVHVAIVTASYGFLGIGSLLGFTNLVLLVLRNKSNEVRVTHTIKELVYIIEIALILGLYMLTIGSFIGGVWANESWGRYWGWDPKETWALVTILVYAFIVHMHKIPGLKGFFQLSTAALLGFGSVLMTYFGVNYYLSGLHSYASGDPPPVPKGLYLAILAVLVLISAAYFSQRGAVTKTDVDESLDEEE